MSATANFKELQYAFTQHMRDPDNAPAPDDVEDRRMEIYRGLLYRNVEGFMANSFPVLRKVSSDKDWHLMIRDYFKHHQARTPLFPKMPQEFLQYLENERDESCDPAFLKELAHYEWVEMSIMLDARDIADISYDREGNFLESVPVLNPLARILSYQYPVHRISPDYIPEEAPEQPSYLVVFRDEEDNVGFLELNPVAARLLDLISQGSGLDGTALLSQIAAELKHPDPDVVIKGGYEIMQQMHSKGVLLGTATT